MSKDTELRQQIKDMVDSLPIENVVFIKEQMALIQKIAYGKLNPKISVHRGKVYFVKFDGYTNNTYKKENETAMRDIIERMNRGKDTKKDQDLVFMVKYAKTGDIKNVTWFSEIQRNYQELDME